MVRVEGPETVLLQDVLCELSMFVFVFSERVGREKGVVCPHCMS